MTRRRIGEQPLDIVGFMSWATTVMKHDWVYVALAMLVFLAVLAAVYWFTTTCATSHGGQWWCWL